MVKGATLGGIAAIITAGGTILALLFTTILPPPDGDTSQVISPTAIVSTSSGPHEVKKSLTLSAEGSDDEDGSIVSYEWDFGDGNSGSGFTTDHTYSERGTYTITLRVVDNDGETDTTQSIINIQPKLGGQPQIEVVDTIAPTINAPSNIFRDSTSSSGTSVTFSVTATDNGVNVPVSCNPSSGSQFPIGTATVTCTATDNAGNTASRSFTVTVKFISPPLNVVEDCLPVNYSTAKVEYTDPWWRIGGHLISDNKAAADRALSIIKHYKFDEVCYVDRPQPPMTYWLTNNQSPIGSFSGEDCISFIPSTLQVKQSGPNWFVQSSTSSMLEFDIEQSANDAIEIIDYYGFNKQCFVDRPNPPMKYFRK